MMEKIAIKQYILSQDTFDVPEVQSKLSLSYGELKTVLDELTKSNGIAFVSGVTYQVLKKSDAEIGTGKRVYKPKNEEESIFLKALWECIKNDSASISFVQRKCVIGYNLAGQAIEWMEENHFISEFNGALGRKILITREQFIEMFGDPDKADEDDEDGEEPDDEDDEEPSGQAAYRKFLEKRRQELLARMRRSSSDEEEDDDDDDDDEENDDDDKPFDLNEYLHKRSREMFTRMEESLQDDEDDDDEEDDEDSLDLRDALNELLQGGFSQDPESQKYTLEINEELKFECEIVDEGKALRISDGGKTLAQTKCTKRRINNILKGYAPVVLLGTEICVTIVDSSDLLTAVLKLYAATDAVGKAK